MLDLIQPFIYDFIDNIIDVEADGNCGCQSVAGLLGMGEDYWSLVHTHLLIELGKFSKDYIKLFGGTDRFEDLRMSLHVDGLTKVFNLCFCFLRLNFKINFNVYICFIQVTMDKWMDKTDMGYVIASRYNVILVSLSHQQSMTFFPIRSQPLRDSLVHHIICIGHVYGNHFV